MSRLHIDFETASTVNLRKVGAAAYARHPDTRVICMAWAFGYEPPAIWVPSLPFPTRVKDHVRAGGTVSGWSLQFEYHIWNFCLKVPVPGLLPEQLDDTQARAVYHGLPFGLEDAGAVLKLSIQKDRFGHDLMMRMSRPRSLNPVQWWHVTDEEKLRDLLAYCKQDVDAERAIADRLPKLPDEERAIWLKDFEANAYGIAVDKPLARRLDALAVGARAAFDRQMSILTEGEVPSVSNVNKLLAWANDKGAMLANVHKATIKAELDAPGYMPAQLRQVLELRRDAAKTSAAKLPVLLAAAPDGIMRGMLAYYGAQRTGRWAGRLLQPQNLPRGVLKPDEVEQALDALGVGATFDDIEMLFGSGLDVIITLIRSCLVARSGRQLVVADFSQIEARVIAWLARQRDLLQVFAAGDDVYTHTARAIGSQSRQLGKVLVLACGFGQGARKFRETAKSYGLDLSEEACEAAVGGWRLANKDIVRLWTVYGRAARFIAQAPHGTTVLEDRVLFGRHKSMMVITLPSQRQLFYHRIRLVNDELAYDGVHQTTKKWTEIRTYGGKLAENITQAVARDVMANTMLCLPSNIDLLLTIHDELICEADVPAVPTAFGCLLAIMRTSPSWAPGLPVSAAGWTGQRYRKG